MKSKSLVFEEIPKDFSHSKTLDIDIPQSEITPDGLNVSAVDETSTKIPDGEPYEEAIKLDGLKTNMWYLSAYTLAMSLGTLQSSWTISGNAATAPVLIV